MHAMTIHKSQGSQADEVTVLLPDEESRLLTRELFYTAVTRAQRKVRVVGPEAAVRAAIGRQAQRASGLRARLADGGNADVTQDPTSLVAVPFLLRVELPDVPGSLGRVASAIGEAGGDIEAIEIVEKPATAPRSTTCCSRSPPGAMPDSIVSACNSARRRQRAVDQPLRRRRQPLPRPRGRRGADRRPGARHWTG